jgi:RimJ/RimL family protein N-acetyltransferase
MARFPFSFRIECVNRYMLQAGDPVNSVNSPPELQIRDICLGSVRDVLSFRTAATAEAFEQFLRHGDRGLFAYWENRVVGHAWAAVSHGRLRVVSGYMVVSPDAPCIHFCSVDPGFRNRKIFQGLLSSLVQSLRQERNAARIEIYASAANAASCAAIERVGFRRVGRVWLMGWRSRQWPLSLRVCALRFWARVESLRSLHESTS